MTTLMKGSIMRFGSWLLWFILLLFGCMQLSNVAAAVDDVSRALAENLRSRTQRLFPFNIVEALKRDSSLQSDEKSELWRIACDLIVSRSAESDAAVCTVEGSLQRHWDNLIVGTRLTSQPWDEYSRTFGMP